MTVLGARVIALVTTNYAVVQLGGQDVRQLSIADCGLAKVTDGHDLHHLDLRPHKLPTITS